MAWKAWLYLCLAVITTVLVADEVAATDISIEDGKGSGLVCDGPVNIFWNVTVTNDDSPSSEYDIFIFGPQFNIEPESVHLELDYGESSVARFQGMILENRAHSQVNVAVDVDSSNGDDVSEYWPVIIDQCANLTLEAEQTRVEGRPGDSLTLSFLIKNRGNGIDTLFLELEGLPAGWQAEFPANLTLDSFESRQMTVNMTADASAAFALRLITTSEIPGLNNITYAEIEVVVQTFFEEYRGRFAGGGLVIAAGVGVALYYRRRLG